MVAYRVAVGHSEGMCAGEGCAPSPAQSTEAKTILLFCEMHGRQKGVHYSIS